MSTSASKLLQFSYSYVPGCRSPSETTVGFAEPLHFEHNDTYVLDKTLSVI